MGNAQSKFRLIMAQLTHSDSFGPHPCPRFAFPIVINLNVLSKLWWWTPPHTEFSKLSIIISQSVWSELFKWKWNTRWGRSATLAVVQGSRCRWVRLDQCNRTSDCAGEWLASFPYVSFKCELTDLGVSQETGRVSVPRPSYFSVVLYLSTTTREQCISSPSRSVLRLSNCHIPMLTMSCYPRIRPGYH